MREKVRVLRGQNTEPSIGIMDSQSVRWGNNRSLNNFGGNKKVKGIKRHVVADKNGFLLAIIVILADGGYRGEVIENIKKKFGYIIQVVMRSDNKKTGFKPIHKRSIIERTFSWFDNDRRLFRNYELLMETSQNMVKIVALRLLLKKFKQALSLY